MALVEVYTKYPCVLCDGVGVVYSKAWDEWWNDYNRLGASDIVWWAKEHPEPEDGEEDACPDCNGKGYIEEWQNLSDLIKAMNT